MKKKITLPVLTILSIALILVGTSYAYWRFTYISDKTNIGKSKCLSIELTNQKNEISLTNTYPISDIEGKKLTPYSFTINNTCDTFISYDVNLEMLEGTTMNSKYMAVMINNEHKELLSNLESANTVMSSSVESRKLVSGSLGVGDSIDYTLRLWIDESVTLSDDAMNKNFTSKVVVTAQPSNYSPKEAGYDTLHDAILANEYQTTPEKAIEKIEAKRTPDLSNTAPIIKWVEKNGSNITLEVIKLDKNSIQSDNQSSGLTENDTLLKLYSNEKLNANTGKYLLSNPVYMDALDSENNINYYYINESVSYDQSLGKLVNRSYDTGIKAYRISSITKSTTTVSYNGISYSAIKYILSATELTQMELETDNSDKGLYKAADDNGITYYYRGNVKNNNVYFGNFYWKIVRINGDNSIRLIYNGTEKNSSGNNQSINNTLYQFNSVQNNPAYAGYMYGNISGTKFDDVHGNTNSSDIKTVMDNWYKLNILDKSLEKYLSYNAGFCGDRTLYSGDGISATSISYFKAYEKYINNLAVFTCPNLVRDLYTTASSNIGNKALTYPIGLITYDELVFAGMNQKQLNKLTYIYSSQHYWTMSPAVFNNTNQTVSVLHQEPNGSMEAWWPVASKYGTRPVINLKADVKISGGIGTANDPYVVDTNN